jgi:predicted O-methyltransferase YrrM
VRALVQADKYAEAMHAFNVLAANDPRAQVVVLPLRDGLTIIRRVA